MYSPRLATMRALAPSIPATSLLESATCRAPARSVRCRLRHDRDLGSAPGCSRSTIPHGTTDVEEYLVSGVSPEQIRWLD
jgi:hypothetical protein